MFAVVHWKWLGHRDARRSTELQRGFAGASFLFSLCESPLPSVHLCVTIVSVSDSELPNIKTQLELFPEKLSIMAQYTLVEKQHIEEHNEYYEVRTTHTDNPKSLFFTTNEENLETTAADVVADNMPGVNNWTIIPHRKDRDNLMYDVS